MEIITNSPTETYELGKKVGNTLKGGEVLALSGEMGAGKTSFIQGLAKGLGIDEQVTSPTFIIMRTYKLADKNFYHLDLYRLEGSEESEIENLGLTSLWNRDDTIFAIEWPQYVHNLPDDTISIQIEKIDDDKRSFKFSKKIHGIKN